MMGGLSRQLFRMAELLIVIDKYMTAIPARGTEERRLFEFVCILALLEFSHCTCTVH